MEDEPQSERIAAAINMVFLHVKSSAADIFIVRRLNYPAKRRATKYSAHGELKSINFF